jgi:hypothetical protein
MLIFHLNALNGDEFDDGQKEAMFVINVQDVNAPDRVIPSRVGFYLVQSKIEKSGRGAVYFNPSKRSLHVISYGEDGEFGVIADACRRELSQNRHPCMIESTMKIMDSISERQCNVVDDLIPITKIMLQYLISSFRVYLDRGRVTVWQCGDNRFHISDVMLGPVYFQSC